MDGKDGEDGRDGIDTVAGKMGFWYQVRTPSGKLIPEQPLWVPVGTQSEIQNILRLNPYKVSPVNID